ncbi:MAG: YceI family protein [Bacteroidota bacterium]
MRNFFLLFFLSSVLLSTISAQTFNIDYLYPIEGSHSYFEFETTYMGYAKVRGSFSTFYGSIYYNPDQPTQTSVSFQIDVESIDTNNDWRDRDLKSKNWFLAEEFPHIHFSSSKVYPEGEGLRVEGALTVKETTKDISFMIAPAVGVIKDIRGDHQVIFTGSYTLNRKEYGVMGKNWSQVKEGIAALSDEVTINFSLLGKQVKEANFKNFLRNPKSPPGAIYVAYQDGGTNAAQEKFNTLKSEMEVNANAINMVAYMLYQQGKYEEALALLNFNQEEFPEEASVPNSIARVYAKMGKLGKAKAHYEKSLALDAKNMNAAEALKRL